MTALYPHLLPEDIPVWERFLAKHQRQYTHFDYDVHAGPCYDPGPAWEENYRNFARQVSCRRIDVVGHKLESLDIIEVTTSAGLTAIGQLNSYPHLYIQTYHPTVPVRALLVAETLQTGIAEVLLATSIAYVLV